ncbi:hypothetical protein M2459_002642 [Parabacteroides sp. PF5-5]|uniref:hypothetical protein n=1 Tax=unclassified Parabacteroides TaxID=2649774 RepID=UPI0024745445|nr:MULTISPECIES: hypothetical protein [unclassified Parabacteroides]MDH6306279.1 hypothetical protein [Parabacteroides sp. PH5-39]MDH6316930.1 hypothetical protein [Parabacteroides sp. PF5-13]MDH6320999.1 hypothetical protein [Parabacteroides sp. PH5-13]MDH6324731.1 hypothetical protein [Parabacteroides sp. PH5-8]MDH6328115.1 hypothetical protein [Parabacteroides sp. PH5-41]
MDNQIFSKATIVNNLAKIITLAEVYDKGKRVAFVKGNREISKENVNAKKKSLRAFGVLVPIMYVSGRKAIADGCSIVGLDGKEIPSEEAGDHIVIIDGQHRFMAAITDNTVNPEEIYMFESWSSENTIALLSEANIEMNKWKGKNFVDGAVLILPDEELLSRIKELTDRKYPLSTASKIYCFNMDITTAVLAACMKGEGIDAEYDLVRAEKFLAVARSKFEEKFIAKRYLIDAVIKLVSGGSTPYEKVFAAIDKLSVNDVKNIIEAKTDVTKIKDIIKSHIETA